MRLIETNDPSQRTAIPHWGAQCTFKTPLKDLPSFVSSIQSSLGSSESATLCIDVVVFDPTHLVSLFPNHPLLGPERYDGVLRGMAIEAETADEVKTLLVAALGDWVDFLFAPTPLRFFIYADHDEATTLFCPSMNDLQRVTQLLESKGYERIADWSRELTSGQWTHWDLVDPATSID